MLSPTGNVVEQRNGTSAQHSYIYHTYTDASNYARLHLGIVGSYHGVVAEQLGTGAERGVVIGTSGNNQLFFRTNGTDRWAVNQSGHLLAQLDNTYDIGTAGATRPRHLYLAANLFLTTGSITWATDNTGDIGASGAVAPATCTWPGRPRSGAIFSRLVTCVQTTLLGWLVLVAVRR